MRTFFITLALVFAVVSAGLIFGWDFGIFDDRGWRQHAVAWLALSAASFAAAAHPWVAAIDRRWYR